MNGKQLKNSILQWAIQGKLVPQDPNDEPASVLLERIRAEKARLVKEGKIKKDKNESIIYRGEDNSHYEKFADGRVVCIDDEIPFEIPKGWEWARINQIAISQLGKTLDRGKQSGIEYPYLCSINVYWDGIDLSKNKTFLLQKEELERYRLAKGDLLVCEGGDYGRCSVWEGGTEMYYQNALHRIRFFDTLSVYFYKYTFELYRQIGYIVGQGQTIKHFTYDNMRGLLFPVPPSPEQYRIVEIINYVIPIIAKYGQSQDKLDRLNRGLNDRLRKSILQEATQGLLVPQDPNDEPAPILLERIRVEKEKLLKEGKIKKKDIVESSIFKGEDNKYYEKIGNKCLDINEEVSFDIPESWVWVRLASIANLYTGNSISETEKRVRYTNVAGKEYIGTKDVGFDHSINYDNGVAIPAKYLPDFRIAPSGSVLMCIEGGSAGRKIAILEKDVCFGNKLCCFAPYAEIAQYIYYYLQSPTFFDVFQRNKTGIIGGVSVNTLKDLLIALPPKEEQVRIVAKIQSLKL